MAPTRAQSHIQLQTAKLIKTQDFYGKGASKLAPLFQSGQQKTAEKEAQDTG